MQLAYVTTYDASDISNWSGLGFHIARSLEISGHEVDRFGSLRTSNHALHLAWKAALRPFGKRHLTERQPGVLQSYACQVKRHISKTNPDIVFSPGSIPVSLLDCDAPIVFWTDASFAGLRSTYPEFENVARESLEKGDAMEQEALSRCRLAIYSSEWAAQSAIDHYDVDPKKVRVVPFGANFDSDKSVAEIEESIDSRETDTCRLLFLGVEWERKGGDIAVEIAARLNRCGLPTELHIVGCEPQQELLEFVKVHGFVSKSTDSGRSLIDDLISNSHFLVQPSRAECYGLAFAEASAHGVPSIATNVGGIPTVVRNGINGMIFDPSTSPNDYASTIDRLMSEPWRYRALARSAHREYRERLNWKAAGDSVTQLLEEITCEQNTSPPLTESAFS